MNLVLMDAENNNLIFDIVEDGKELGGLELTVNNTHIFIDNIHLYERYRGKGYLKHIIQSVINEFDLPILCVPLPNHIEKFKHLGFEFSHNIKEDNYYSYLPKYFE